LEFIKQTMPPPQWQVRCGNPAGATNSMS
jgi:hypothetical protein